MKIALLDGDIIAYRCAASAENDSQDISEVRADDLIRRILHNVNAQEYELYLGGEDNYRYKIYPEYKANRTQAKPIWLQTLREHLVRYWNGQIVNGMETDDKLGIQQTKYQLDSIICTIDKDLLQVPGHHYSWEISGTSSTGKQWVRPEEHRFVSPFDGLRTFYKQLIMGDGGDNIPGYDGKLRNSVPKFIQKLQAPIDEMTEEWDMFHYVEGIYDPEWQCIEQLNIMKRNAQLLYILKEEERYWSPPEEKDASHQSLNQD